jgi:hypothetical protein
MSRHGERFVSTMPACKGPSDTNQGLLGYAMLRPFPG